MKKAFDANVSRAKPRMRLGLLTAPSAEAEVDTEASVSAASVEALAQQVVAEAPSLSAAIKERAAANASRVTMAERMTQALEREEAVLAMAVQAEAHAPVAHAEPPPELVEVQTAPEPTPLRDIEERRASIKERIKAVRQNPRPEPLPDTVAEAGVLAVERISALQSELAKARAMNLALTQDLEAARRQSERATEEARTRMDEARRLSKEMESRVSLLNELERELESLEGERNESLLALQEARQLLDAREKEKHELMELVSKKDAEIADSLAEEERLAAELETAQENATSLRRSTDALKTERDTLARQVAELTRERAELLEARKALEAVHRALSSAAAR